MEEKKELLDQDERVVEIELERLRGFVNHPFKVQADSQMIELQESMYDDYYYYEEQRKAEAKSEAALAGTFATVIGGIVGAVLSCALFLVRRFDILSSGVASLLFYMLTYTQEWNKVIYIVGALTIFIVSMILQYVLVVAKIIYTVFVCIVAALIGGCWKTYDSEMQRNLVMLICFVITGILGVISWCGWQRKNN